MSWGSSTPITIWSPSVWKAALTQTLWLDALMLLAIPSPRKLWLWLIMPLSINLRRSRKSCQLGRKKDCSSTFCLHTLLNSTSSKSCGALSSISGCHFRPIWILMPWLMPLKRSWWTWGQNTKSHFNKHFNMSKNFWIDTYLSSSPTKGGLK